LFARGMHSPLEQVKDSSGHDVKVRGRGVPGTRSHTSLEPS